MNKNNNINSKPPTPKAFFQELEYIAVKRDLPGTPVRKGDRGTILDVFDRLECETENCYEVVFEEKDHFMMTLGESDLESVFLPLQTASHDSLDTSKQKMPDVGPQKQIESDNQLFQTI
jgi:hypothetical protein